MKEFMLEMLVLSHLLGLLVLFFSGYENYLMLDSLSTRGRLLDEGAMLDENFTQQYQIRS